MTSTHQHQVRFCSALAVLLFLTRSLLAAWSSDPAANTPICTAVYSQHVPDITLDGTGGAIMAWADSRSGQAKYAQRVNAAGEPLWALNGVSVPGGYYPTIGSDGAGGAFVAGTEIYYEWRFRTNTFTPVLRRVTADSSVNPGTALGTMSFSADSEDTFGPIGIVGREAGGAIVFLLMQNRWDTTFFATRINSNGTEISSATICAGPGYKYSAKPISDGEGGALFGWLNDSTNEVYVQRVDPYGYPMWGPNGLRLGPGTPVGSLFLQLPGFASDGNGGAIVAWSDDRDGGTSDDLFAQHVDATGNIQWTTDGLSLCNAPGVQYSPQLVSDQTSGAIVTWYDKRNGSYDIYAQRVNGDGSPQWAPEGVAVCTADTDQTYPQIVPDGKGGAIVSWWDYRNDSVTTGTDIYCARISGGGDIPWTPNGIPVSTAKRNQGVPRVLAYHRMISDGMGGAILAWEDERNPVSSSDIYAAHVTANGALGPTTATQVFDENTTLDLGWSQIGETNPSQHTSYDSTNTALLATIAADPTQWRIIGWYSNPGNTIYYSSVGTDHFVRAKYYVYATGQNTSALNEIPDMRMRIANRFAVSSILKVSNHLNEDPESTAISQDIRPSTSPLSPSLYRVDLDPIDVPQLVNHPTTEGFLRMFETYEHDPQGNGSIAVTECSVGVYPALPDSTTTVPVTSNGLIKSYRTTSTGGGDFGTGNIASSNSAITIAKYFNGALETTAPQPSVTIDSSGVTLETLSVQSDRLALAALDVFNDTIDQTNHLTRARIEPGKQYKLRFHATSTKQSNTQALVRFRARTIKFAYTATIETGGATGASIQNNTITSQALPGIGNQIPAFDRISPTENGGWYNVLMITPMNPDIQPTQPNLYAQDPPGIDTQPANNSKSRRDLQFGFDIIDTFSTQPTSGQESGQMTVDRVEIEKYDLMPD